MKKLLSLILFAAAALTGRAAGYDVCVYGGTSAGVIAATSAKRLGMNVLLVEPGIRLGGLSSGGLGYTDIGNKQVVSGLSKDFYRRIGAHYGTLEKWIFEPKVAEGLFLDYIRTAKVEVLYKYRVTKVIKDGVRIAALELESSDGSGSARRVDARMFIDCTYEGDVMARAGVTYTVGREANSLYGETYNGVQLLDGHQFPDGVDPYKNPGDPSSGLLWGISPAAMAAQGSGDGKVQAYNYRICLTDDPANRIPIARPEGYDPSCYELLLRLMDAQPDKRTLGNYFIWNRMPGRKTDVNNKGAFSTDMIGENYDYPEASYAERERIVARHKEYTLGLLYFVGNDSRVPDTLRTQILRWGLPKDEYVEFGNWSPSLYIREARRMVSDYVMTQDDCQARRTVTDGIAMAAYTMDSHNCQRIVVEKDGRRMVKNEGNVEVGGFGPFPIAYRSITPRVSECTNLLVPVCLSASHIAYGSIRMEPVFMVLGQSAAIAAAQALRAGKNVQAVDVAAVQRVLRENPLLDGSPADVFADDLLIPEDARKGWRQATRGRSYGPTFLVREDPAATVRFTPELTRSGKYRVYTYFLEQNEVEVIRYTVNDGGKQYPVDIQTKNITLDRQAKGEWVELGVFNLNAGSSWIEVGSSGKGTLTADAMLLIPM